MNNACALLRLASPQLPIGGYSYSQGLEMAVENGTVNDAQSAQHWIADQLLLNLARFEAPLLLAHCMAAAQDDWGQLLELSAEHRASRETRELQLESRQMGYSLKQLLLGLAELDIPARRYLAQIEEPHLALGWALAARAWNIPAQDALAALDRPISGIIEHDLYPTTPEIPLPIAKRTRTYLQSCSSAPIDLGNRA